MPCVAIGNGGRGREKVLESAAAVGLGLGLGLGPGLSGSTTNRLHHHLQCHVAAAVEGRVVARS